MAGYRISEAARLAGFAPSALRYYEGEGLLPRPGRTAGGYRCYDDAAVERLRFVHRARQLGLGLGEIRDLVAVWDAGACAPAQRDLAARIAARRTAVAERITELQALSIQLLAAEHAVSAPAGKGACGPGCACLATPDVDPEGDVPDRDATNRGDDPSPELACTLDAAQLPERLAAWAELVVLARAREATESGERLVFTPAPGLAARISDLCAREQACCPFFTFTLHLGCR